MKDAAVIEAVSVALMKEDAVLLVKRGREPSKGQFAFPGGRVEHGEKLEEAARRELMEETGLECGELSLVRVVDIDAPPLTFRLNVFAAPYIGGVASPADDAEEAVWFRLDEMEPLPLSDSVMAMATALLAAEKRP